MRGRLCRVGGDPEAAAWPDTRTDRTTGAGTSICVSLPTIVLQPMRGRITARVADVTVAIALSLTVAACFTGIIRIVLPPHLPAPHNPDL